MPVSAVCFDLDQQTKSACAADIAWRSSVHIAVSACLASSVLELSADQFIA